MGLVTDGVTMVTGGEVNGTGDITTTGFATATILQNPITYSGSITIDTDRNAIVAGPFTVTGTLTIPSGSTFVVV